LFQSRRMPIHWTGDAAEVISGLDTAFEHYEEKSESGWNKR